jgi:YHS domain-containing protein
MIKAPVSGLEGKPEQAAGMTERSGQTYYFCTTACKQRFDQDPDSFKGKQSQ